MQNHDSKIAPNPNRLRVGSRVHVRDARLPNSERREGRLVALRAAEVALPPTKGLAGVCWCDGDPPCPAGCPEPERFTHAVLCIVVFPDGSALPFAESELEPRSEEPRIIKPGRIQPATIIRR